MNACINRELNGSSEPGPINGTAQSRPNTSRAAKHVAGLFVCGTASTLLHNFRCVLEEWGPREPLTHKASLAKSSQRRRL